MTDVLANRLSTALGPAYEVGGLLGKGGMGAVYRATDRRLRREVAVKVLPPELGYSSELRARFSREAQMAAQLSHPNIVSIHDVGERDDLAWFTMAFVDGESVRAKVEREGPQTITVVRRVLQEVAQALAYAHARGVIHRDIKPDNIMLDRGSGRSMVTDFGIAKALSPDGTDVTQPGEVVGTARYMAPEQALAETVDGRSDMYSLGLVGYFMLTGTHAIKGGSLPAVIAEYVKGPTVSLRSLDRRLPAALVAALERCLAPKPEGRFARMEEVAESLRAAGGELPDTPGPIRLLIRETERGFLFGSLGLFAVGVAGVENVPSSLLILVVGALSVQWVSAVEQCTRAGLGWATLRRAMYVERARRIEEIEGFRRTKLGIVGWLAFGGMVVATVLLMRPSHQTGINPFLVYGGIFGGFIGASIFGMPKRRSTNLVSPRVGRVIIGSVMLAFVLLFGFMMMSSAPPMSLSKGLQLVLALILIGVPAAGFAIVAYRLAKRAQEKLSRPELKVGEVPEWRVPRWLDVAGSWLFARIHLNGWRVRIERDLPAAAAESRLGVSAAMAAEKRIRQLAQRVESVAHAPAFAARQLAGLLVAECRRAEQELKPLLAKVARLSEGVLVSRTVAAGGSLESELDRAERDADALRAHARECSGMLDQLVRGLETVAASRDTSALDSAIRRGRELSSGVRRLILRAEAT